MMLHIKATASSTRFLMADSWSREKGYWEHCCHHTVEKAIEASLFEARKSFEQLSGSGTCESVSDAGAWLRLVSADGRVGSGVR